MKFETTRETLAKALTAITSGIRTTQTDPTYFWMTAETDGYIKLTASKISDMTVSCYTQMVNTGYAGQVAIDITALKRAVKALPKKSELTFRLDGDKVTITTENNSVSLPVDSTADVGFMLPAIDTGFIVGAPVDAFMAKLDQVSPMMATQDVRYYLNGMLVDIVGGKATLVTTDGHRLAKIETRGWWASKTDGQYIVPREVIRMLPKLQAFMADTSINIYANETTVSVVTNGVTVTSKLIDGKFPAYDRAIPSNALDTIKVDRKALVGALKQSLAVKNAYPVVRLEIINGKVVLNTQNKEGATHSQTLACEQMFEGENIIGFNASHLLDAAQVNTDDALTFAADDPTSADGSWIIRANAANAVQVILPKRL